MEGESKRNSDHLVKHQFQPGQSGNKKGKPPGTPTRKTIIRQILDTKLKDRDVIMAKLREVYPDYFEGKKKVRSIEEILWTIHTCQAMFEPKMVDVRIDIFNRIHGKPVQAIMTLDQREPAEDSMTTDQTREALAHIQSMLHQFEDSKKHIPQATSADGPED